MRLGLIGATGHWQTYAPALAAFPTLKLAAVATASEEETLGAFDHAPARDANTRAYPNPLEMLEHETLDVVQVSCRPDRIPLWTRACLERGVPVVAEKPLAMDIGTLKNLYAIAKKSGVPLLPMHTMRESGELAAVAQAVQSGKIGKPLLISNQKTYRWGDRRDDYYRSRRTFPGLSPFIGIHVFDWLYWIFGDIFTEVSGSESAEGRRDYPACASHAAYLLKGSHGVLATITLDYLRPKAAPSHNDERFRVAGTEGVLELTYIEKKITLIQNDAPLQTLPLLPQEDIFTRFIRHLKGQGNLPLSLEEAFRITEIALRTQQAVDTKRSVSLRNSLFSPSVPPLR